MLATSVAVVRKMLEAVAGSKPSLRRVSGISAPESPLTSLPRFAGGKSMGGRMSSRAVASGGLDVRGLVFFGFPLHAAGRPPNVERAAHLAHVPRPMLFLQGTRDALADPTLVRAVCDGLVERATLHAVEGADHGFHVLKRSGRDDAGVIEELAEVAAAWMDPRSLPAASAPGVDAAPGLN